MSVKSIKSELVDLSEKKNEFEFQRDIEVAMLLALGDFEHFQSPEVNTDLPQNQFQEKRQKQTQDGPLQPLRLKLQLLLLCTGRLPLFHCPGTPTVSDQLLSGIPADSALLLPHRSAGNQPCQTGKNRTNLVPLGRQCWSADRRHSHAAKSTAKLRTGRVGTSLLSIPV